MRRFLGLYPWDWDRLPSWLQTVYREGLELESPWIGRSVMLNKADNPLDVRAGAFASPYEDQDEGSADDLAGFGIQVHRSEKFTPVYRSAANG